MVAYIHNTGGYRFAEDMFGKDSHPSYLEEYATLYTQAPTRAIGKLDDAHLRKLFLLAMERYGQHFPRGILRDTE